MMVGGGRAEVKTGVASAILRDPSQTRGSLKYEELSAGKAA
jgi:hypothetical protein